MREDSVFGSTLDASTKAFATQRNEAVNNMAQSIGFKTASVNGFQTDNRTKQDRLIYRTMSFDLLARIQQRLGAVKLSESGACRKAGLSPDAIRNFRRDLGNGKSRSMNAATLEALAPILKTTVHWLLTGDGSEEPAHDVTVTMVPKISWVSAGKLTSMESIDTLEHSPRVPVADLGPGDWILLDVDGDSMDRISPPGSQIAVNRRDNRLVANACYVIATEDGEATYKRYRPAPERFEPVSTNPIHEAIFPEGPVTIVGRVKRSMIDM